VKRIAVLGSTGSIGTQTLDVAGWRNYEVVGLAAGKNAGLLLEQVKKFKPKLISCDASIVNDIAVSLPKSTKLVSTDEVARMEADTVVAAIPGIAGLKPTLAALESGHHVALANKETMVVAGPLVWEVARKHKATLTPVDSEHSALFQCLVGEAKDDVASLILTASGGPFRIAPNDLSQVTPEQALKHPNWSMGSKVTIDSATLFNKGLEVLEAHFLFEMPLENIEVVIHPQSIIHSLVRFKDGNLKAQIGPHDMRIPIHYAIEYPQRPLIPLEPLSLRGSWEFFEPDSKRFPSLALAYQAGKMGGVAPVALNAADEIAVSAFLSGQIRFTDIPVLLEKTLEKLENTALSWESIEATDAWARALVEEKGGRRKEEGGRRK
jgi:1-deoxy-D-xylulose-5-phosphate reductoisomerase